jgi:hypothetical protein
VLRLTSSSRSHRFARNFQQFGEGAPAEKADAIIRSPRRADTGDGAMFVYGHMIVCSTLRFHLCLDHPLSQINTSQVRVAMTRSRYSDSEFNAGYCLRWIHRHIFIT